MHHTAARTTLHARTVQLTITLGVALLVTPLNAAAQPRDAFNGGPITGPRARSIECNGGRFLTGVTEQLTDRIVGIGFTCYRSTRHRSGERVRGRIAHLPQTAPHNEDSASTPA